MDTDKMTKGQEKRRVPQLRFPEFREDPGWEKSHLEDIANFVRKRIASKCVSKENYIGTENLLPEFDGIKDASSLPATSTVVEYKENDILISNIRPYLKKIWLSDRRGGASSDVLVIRSNKVNYFFLFSVLASDGFIAYVVRDAKGVKMPRGDISSIKKYPIFVPSSKEQQKIADCLSSVDALIGLQGRKVEQLARHKQALLQQLFPADGDDCMDAGGRATQDAKAETTPRLRFPEYCTAPAWERAPLGKLASRCTKRNRDSDVVRVLTNSAEHGVVDQREYFDKDIANQGNLGNYFIVEKGDFVYNPRISSFAPVGPISRNNIGRGVMSPLYTVFRFKRSNSDFYEHYFKSSAWHLYLRQVGNAGARHDRMAISNSDFMAIPLPVPSPEEQQKIANCLSSLDTLIDLHRRKLEALKRHKQGLMQQLFPAEEEA